MTVRVRVIHRNVLPLIGAMPTRKGASIRHRNREKTSEKEIQSQTMQDLHALRKETDGELSTAAALKF